MAIRSQFAGLQLIERLTGRENYRSWAIAMKAFLLIDELWDTIEAPDGGTVSTDASKICKALAKLTLSVDPTIFVHITEATSAQQAWNNLKKSYDDSGLMRKVSMLREVSTTKLSDSGSMEEYIRKIMTAAQQLEGTGMKLPTELLGALLLAGLPEAYQPMIMAMEASGQSITADLVKTKLIQEVPAESFRSDHSSRGFYTRTASKEAGRGPERRDSKTGIRCFNCNKIGHFARDCRSKPKRRTDTSAHTANDTGNENEQDEEEVMCALLSTLERDKASPIEWILDSGASKHMCRDETLLRNLRESNTQQVVVADKSRIPVKGCGDVFMSVQSESGTHKIKLCNVLLVPKLSTNLVSVRAITLKGFNVNFVGNKCFVKDQNNKVIFTASAEKNNVFKLNLAGIENKHNKQSLSETCMSTKAEDTADINLWHKRMGHLNEDYLRKLNSDAATGINFSKGKLEKCEACIKGKLVKAPFKLNEKRATEKLALVHSDVCQLDYTSLGGAKYFLTLLDDHSRKIFVYFLKHKDEVSKCISHFIKYVDNQFGLKIKILRTDNGREYVNRVLEEILENAGIKHETSIPYNPQQNGRAERVNRTLLEKVRCMLQESGLDKKFWAEALATAAYLNNRSPKDSLNGKTPEEIWTGQRPDLSNIRVFGCKALAHIPDSRRGKLDSKAIECSLLGYCTTQKGYRLWDTQRKKVFTSRDVIFLEEKKKDSVTYLPDEDRDVETQQAAPSSQVFQPQVEEVQETAPGAQQPQQQLEDIQDHSDMDLDESLPTRESEHTSSSGEDSEEEKTLRRPTRKPKKFDDFVVYHVATLLKKFD